jgi:hypothetical protein
LLNDSTNEDKSVLIIAGSAEEAVRLLQHPDLGTRLQWHCVMAQEHRASLWDNDWAVANDEVDTDRVMKDLILEVTENFGDQKKFKARQTHLNLTDTLSQLREASQRLPSSHFISGAEVKQALKRVHKEISLAEQLTQKAIARLAKEM